MIQPQVLRAITKSYKKVLSGLLGGLLSGKQPPVFFRETLRTCRL